jgi:hypothetical protein
MTWRNCDVILFANCGVRLTFFNSSIDYKQRVRKAPYESQLQNKQRWQGASTTGHSQTACRRSAVCLRRFIMGARQE